MRSPAAGAVLGFPWQENQSQSPVNICSQLGGVYKPILFSLWIYLADSLPLNMPDAKQSFSPPWTSYVWNATFLLDSNAFKAHPFKTQERASHIVYKKSSYIPLCFIVLPSLPPASYLPHTPWPGNKSTDLHIWAQHTGNISQTHRIFYLLSHWPQECWAKHSYFTWSTCGYWESLPDLMAIRAFLWKSWWVH